LKAALLFEKDDIRIVDLPMPTVGPNDILLHVKAAKVCPTDLRKFRLGSKDALVSTSYL
jgi:L-iditol 2-dehydrogenase